MDINTGVTILLGTISKPLCGYQHRANNHNVVINTYLNNSNVNISTDVNNCNENRDIKQLSTPMQIIVITQYTNYQHRC